MSRMRKREGNRDLDYGNDGSSGLVYNRDHSVAWGNPNQDPFVEGRRFADVIISSSSFPSSVSFWAAKANLYKGFARHRLEQARLKGEPSDVDMRAVRNDLGIADRYKEEAIFLARQSRLCR